MTTRLYYTDAYLTRFESAVAERADGGRRVYLERTAFYPASGGQPFDLGILGGVPVVEVVEEDDGRIAHLLAAPIPETADVVAGEVDWARRLDHMQQHTGQHLLSALFADLLGHATLSVHFGADSATLDLDAAALPGEAMVEVERRANEIVAENRAVTVSFERADAAAGLRKAPARTGELRIVSIEGIDRSACAGTHVRRTGEIGPVVLRRTERVRGGTRVEFVCGHRAVERARADYETLADAAQFLSASLDMVPALVRALGSQAKERETQVRRLEQELAQHRARALHDAAHPDARGLRRVVGVAAAAAGEALDADAIRALAHAFVALPRTVFAAATAGTPATLFVAASEDSGVSAGAVLKEALAAVGGRGGGNPRMAQGSVPDPSRLGEVYAAIDRATGR